MTLAMDPVGPHRILISFLLKYFMDMRSNLSYGASWTLRPKWPIFKVKRAPEQLLSQLALTDKTTHYKGQTSNETGTFVKTLDMELVGPHGQNNTFSRSNELWSRPGILDSFLSKFFMVVR
ncbi:hypothetical protein H5410_024047 [Solanum commersonii]|uniref:Uncharacterized protein n=1 Tax=Solanum commersonii TaxID=4109 RepID=A0A9J5ZKW5_SOLCO|nr:hypothetical protein H5410_024047 [Solanum commersonii]